MSESTRTIAGFLVAPFASAVMLWAVGVLWRNADPVATLGLIPILYLFTAAPLIVVGTPIYLVLRRFDGLNVWSILASGAGAGSLAAIGLRLPSLPTTHDIELCACVGTLTSLVFWLIWRPKTCFADQNT